MVIVQDVYQDIKMEMKARLTHEHTLGSIIVWLANQYHDTGAAEYKRVMCQLTRAEHPYGWMQEFCGE